MADTVTQLIADVRVEGGFDVDSTTALRWINRRWTRMVGDARAYRKKVAVGTTVNGTAFYAFSPVEAYSFEVDGVPYGRARRPDVYASAQGRLVWENSGDGSGLILEDADSSAARGITIVPTPTSALAITSFAAIKPPLLTDDASGNTLLLNVLEDEFSDELVAGAIATGLVRVNHRADLAAPHEQMFMSGIERLKERTTSRFRGQSPAQIRIEGVNA